MTRRALWIRALLASLVAGAASGATPTYLRVAHPGEADSLDPQVGLSAPALVVAVDLFEGLYTLDNNGRPVLGAAASMRETRDAGGPVVEFTLRPGLRWSDGAPLTAADFEYSFKRLADPATGGTLLASNVGLIRKGADILAGRLPAAELGVRALDDLRLRLELVRDPAWFKTVLAFPTFAPVPRHVIARHGRGWTRPGVHVSNGAFMLSEWKPNNYIQVLRNPRFHSAATVRLSGVRYLPVTDQNAAYRLFESGQIDTMTNFPPEKLDDIRNRLAHELHLAPSLGVTMYFYNFRRPMFRDLRIRQALALAIDRERMTTRIVRTGDKPAYGLVTGGLPEYLPPVSPALPTQAARLAQARRLLRAAGYGPARPLGFELLYHTSEEHKNVALAAASMWQQLGIKVRLRNAERQVVEVATRNGDFDMVRAALFAAYPDANGLFNYFLTGNSANGSGYSNAAFDGMVAAAEGMPAGAERAQTQRRAENILVADQAFLPLYFMTSRRLVSRRVSGWSDRNLTALRPARYLAVQPD
jgi:oligopeptide transport system substrate-binding protein